MEALELVNKAEKELQEQFKIIEENEYLNSKKVLEAFKHNQISEVHFNGITEYA